jgi:hygromycin-B 4-O-kinase
VDEGAARTFLARRFGDAAQVTVMRPGEWSTAYSVRTADADLVARFSPYDEDFEKDAYAARYSSPALPVPPIIDSGPTPDGFYAVAPRMPGAHIDFLDAPGLQRVLPSFFSMLDAIRAVDLSAASGYGGWPADGRTRHRTWHEDLLGVATGPATRGSPPWRELLAASPSWVATFEEGYARLRELVPFCPEDRHLIHDDLMNRNVLVDGDRITAVLDWGSSKYGDFVFDLAKPVFYEPWWPQWKNIDFAAAARVHYADIGLDVPHFEERLRCYCLHEGIGGMAYSAFRERWTEVDRKAARVLEFVRA